MWASTHCDWFQWPHPNSPFISSFRSRLTNSHMPFTGPSLWVRHSTSWRHSTFSSGSHSHSSRSFFQWRLPPCVGALDPSTIDREVRPRGDYRLPYVHPHSGMRGARTQCPERPRGAWYAFPILAPIASLTARHSFLLSKTTMDTDTVMAMGMLAAATLTVIPTRRSRRWNLMHSTPSFVILGEPR